LLAQFGLKGLDKRNQDLSLYLGLFYNGYAQASPPARFEEALAILAKAWTSPKWSNPESQNSGKIALVRKFTRNGQQCETLDYRTKRRPVGPQHYRLSSCLQPDGQWRLI
jgi:hypothetical protein